MRMHLKKIRKSKSKSLNIITIIIVLLIISTIYALKIFNEKAIPQFISYADVETKRIISLLINTTVTNTVVDTINYDNLFITTKDDNGNIVSIDFNSKEVNKILDETSKTVEDNINNLSNGRIDLLTGSTNIYDNDKLNKGIIYKLPSGIIFNNTILNNILPKIPVKIDLISNVFCRINTDIKSYGINNALMNVSIRVTASVKVLLPFISDTIEVVADIPIILKIIEGGVPGYYFDGYLNSVTN